MGFLTQKQRVMMAVGTLVGVVFLSFMFLKGAGLFSRSEPPPTTTAPTTGTPEQYPTGVDATGATSAEGVPMPTQASGEVYGCRNTTDYSIVHPLNQPTGQGHICTYIPPNTCLWNARQPAVCVRR